MYLWHRLLRRTLVLKKACIGYKQPAYIFPSFLYADTWQPIAAKCPKRIRVRRKDVE